MRTYLLLAMLMVPLAVAAGDQVYEPMPESYGYFSDELPSGESYLGVDTRDITPERVTALKLKNESGVEVTMVDQDAPAGKAGIKEQDVILTVNGTKVESVEQLRRMIHETPPGRTVTVGLSRNGQPVTVQAQLAGRKTFRPSIPPVPMTAVVPHISMPSFEDMDIPVSVVVVHSAMRSGLMVENLTRQLGDFFGAKEGHGVLVRSVEKGSRAEKAGFRAGDVIVRVDKDPIRDSSDFSHSLQSPRRSGPVDVGIIRDKREQTIRLSLPPRKESGEFFGEDISIPDIQGEVQLEIENQMARLRPQMELARQQARRAGEEARKALQRQQKELRKQMREQGSEIRDQIREQQREIQRELLELQHQASQF